MLAGTGSDQVVDDAEGLLADLDPGAVWEQHDLSAAAGLLLALENRARHRPAEAPPGRLSDVGDRIAAHLEAG